MRNEELKKLIDKLNSGKTPDQFFLRPLEQNVYWAKYWSEKIIPSCNPCFPDGPIELYFIKNDESTFVGGVLDMTHDLHWFMLPKFRRKGALSKALCEVIMPHLFFMKGRETQRITIDSNFLKPKQFKASEKVAIAAGFKKINEDDGISEYEAIKTECTQQIFIEGQNTAISEERRDVIVKKINYLARSLWTVQNEVEMLMGDKEYSEEINWLVLELKRHVTRFEDKWYENRN